MLYCIPQRHPIVGNILDLDSVSSLFDFAVLRRNFQNAVRTSGRSLISVPRRRRLNGATDTLFHR